jgi:putative oxidoreductase
MNLFSTTPTQRQLAFGLLILRIALGAVFIIHGGQKLFMMGLGGTAGMFTQMGIPAPGVIGPIIALLEPLAGGCVLLGLITRLAGLAIACDMMGAILTFHIHHGFFVPTGIEFVMMNCASGFVLAMLGAGQFSIDHIIDQRRSQT